MYSVQRKWDGKIKELNLLVSKEGDTTSGGMKITLEKTSRNLCEKNCARSL